MKMKEGSEKVGLKLNIQKTKIMAPSPITSWQIYGETVETVADFIFLGSKITADGDCSHEIKRLLLLGRKVMTNLDSILKSRDITLSTKVCLVKAMGLQRVRHDWTELNCVKIYKTKYKGRNSTGRGQWQDRRMYGYFRKWLEHKLWIRNTITWNSVFNRGLVLKGLVCWFEIWICSLGDTE